MGFGHPDEGTRRGTSARLGRRRGRRAPRPLLERGVRLVLVEREREPEVRARVAAVTRAIPVPGRRGVATDDEGIGGRQEARRGKTTTRGGVRGPPRAPRKVRRRREARAPARSAKHPPARTRSRGRLAARSSDRRGRGLSTGKPARGGPSRASAKYFDDGFGAVVLVVRPWRRARSLVSRRLARRYSPPRAARLVVDVGVAPRRPTPARRRRPPSTRPFVSIWTSRTTSADGWRRATSSACSCSARRVWVSPP